MQAKIVGIAKDFVATTNRQSSNKDCRFRGAERSYFLPLSVRLKHFSCDNRGMISAPNFTNIIPYFTTAVNPTQIIEN